MKKYIILFLIILMTGSITVSAQEGFVLRAGISLINAVPKQFFGTWTVVSAQTSTDSPKTFSKGGIDIWNLRRSGNVIELRNPVTAAVAEIYLDDVNGDEVIFTHYEKDGDIEIKDSVILKVNGNSFVGRNEIIMTTTRYDKYLRRNIVDVKKASYDIKGTKLAE